MCSRLGCLAGHKVNVANGLSVNGVIKIGLQKDKSNVCEPGESLYRLYAYSPLCISSYLVPLQIHSGQH